MKFRVRANDLKTLEPKSLLLLDENTSLTSYQGITGQPFS
jgi:hypothetical protein